MAPRRPWLAALLALFRPGLGHVYVGRLRNGLLWGAALDALLLSGLLMCVVFPRAAAAITWGRVLPLLPLWLAQAMLAWTLARRATNHRLTSVNRLWVYVLFVVGFWLVGGIPSRLIRELLIEPFKASSSSMEPALEAGDQFYVFKRGPGAKLERGAVIAWNNPRVGKTMIHRIVGMPGDTVVVLAGDVSIGARSLAVGPCAEPTYSYVEDFDGRSMPRSGSCRLERDGAYDWRTLHVSDRAPGDGTFEVPPDTLFVMGDNRDNALDSRFDSVVPLADVVGRVGPVWISFAPGSWVPRLNRIGNVP